MIPDPLGTLHTRRALLDHFISTYWSWNVSFVSFQQRASRRFCTSQAAFFVSLMCAYGVYPLSKYGGTCWVKNRRSIIDILLDPNQDDQTEKILLKSSVSSESVTPLTYQINVVNLGQKKNILCGNSLTSNWIKIGYFVQKHSTKLRKIFCNSILRQLDAHLIL